MDCKRNGKRNRDPKGDDNYPTEETVRRIANVYGIEQWPPKQKPRKHDPERNTNEQTKHGVGRDARWTLRHVHNERTDKRKQDKNREWNTENPQIGPAQVARSHHLTRHKISCREPAVHATQNTLATADTPSVNDRLARGQLRECG